LEPMGGLEALLALAPSAGNFSARPDPLLATRIGPSADADPLSLGEPGDCQLLFLGSRVRRGVQPTGSMVASPNGPAGGSMARGNGALEVFRCGVGEIDPDPSRSWVDFRFRCSTGIA